MKRFMRTIATLLTLTGLQLVACAWDDPDQIKADFERLTAEAQALVKTGPCSQVSDCRSAAVGTKACGGPREYWVYCKTATPEADR